MFTVPINISLKLARINPIRPGLFWVPGMGPWRGGGGGGVPAAFNSKTIHDIEMKFSRVVENHKLINLV